MDAYRIDFLRTAQKELAYLPPNVQGYIADKIEALKTNPRPLGVKTIESGSGHLRLHIGNYRLIYRVEDDSNVVLVVKVGERRNMYR